MYGYYRVLPVYLKWSQVDPMGVQTIGSVYRFCRFGAKKCSRYYFY